jgi:hypothetical protein
MHLRGQWQTNEQLADIGRVIVESASLEQLVEQMIVDFVGEKPEICEILIGTQMLGTKIDLLSRIAPLKLRSEKDKRDLSGLIDRIRELNNLRTIAVHGIWTPRGRGRLSMILSLPPPLQPSDAATKRKPKNILKAERLSSLGTDIQKARQDLWTFWLHRRLSPAQIRAKRRKAAAEGA